MKAITNRALAWCVCATMFIASVLAGAAAAPYGRAATDVDNNRRFIQEAFDRWAAGGTSFFNEVVAENVVWRIKGSGPSAGEYNDRETFLERAVRPFAARMSVFVRPTAVKIWADGDHVIAQWDGAGVARDGMDYSNSYVWIFRMQDGKATDVTAFLDLVPYDDILRRIPAPSR